MFSMQSVSSPVARGLRTLLVGALVMLPGAAFAVQPVVKSVPWVVSNPLIPHDTVSGVAHTVKGTANVQGAFTYVWDFGDGSPVATGAVSNKYNISASHTYTGSPGDVFTARLTVTDNATSEDDSETYFVAIRTDELGTRVNMAIDRGLWYLHTTMTRTTSGSPAQDVGYWTSGNAASSYISDWASNVQAFEVNGHLETGAASNPYTETVARGLRYLMAQLTTGAIPATDTNPLGTFSPDTNGNAQGVRPAQGTDFYQGGMIMDAIVATGTPAVVATLGPLAGRTYGTIVQDMVDWYSYCQYDANPYGGGWYYSCDGWVDGSISQWAAIGMIAAERNFGATVPQIVKDYNKVWVDYAHDIATGISGYNGTAPVWGPYATTPSGMVQMTMDGMGRGNALWDKSENFLRNNFCNTGGATNAIRDYYYGLFSFTKSMLLHDPDGNEVSDPITLLSNQPGNTNGIDWYAAEASKGAPCDGVARTLVNEQNASGYWYGNNYYSEQYAFETSWAIIMLNRTVFETGVPVAVAEANPNPAVAFQTVNLDGSDSFHQDPALSIMSWNWDLDNDGAFDDASGPTASRSFPAVGDYPVNLRVCDNASPTSCDDTTVIVRVTTPPLAPTADAGGPYSFCPVAKPWFLDGSGSINPDDGLSEPGKPGDFIQAYDWDLDGDGQFDDAAGSLPDATAYFTGTGTGDFLIRLRVTDNTVASFPSSGQPDLTDTDSAQVSVRAATDPVCATCISNLKARPKTGKVQLTWTPVAGAAGYKVFRGTISGGPYLLIGTTTSNYSTYLDTNVVNGTTYYYIVRPTALNGAEVCQSNQASAKPPVAR